VCFFIDVVLHGTLAAAGAIRSKTEQVATQWQPPVASGVDLDMLHQAMHTALHPHFHMAKKMASRGGALFPIVNF
jgi:hypothetical protein